MAVRTGTRAISNYAHVMMTVALQTESWTASTK